MADRLNEEASNKLLKLVEEPGNKTVFLFIIDKNNSLADLGILIGERGGRGRGYGCEAWYALMDYLFTKETIRKITAGALEHNKKMIDIFEKCQMILEASRPNHYEINGSPVTVVYYSTYRGNWN